MIFFSWYFIKQKIYENISVYDISYKTSMGQKLLRIRFDKIDGFIRVSGSEFKYLVLFDNGLFDKICDKIKYFISEKIDIADSNNHNFWEIRIDSHNYLPIEKILTFHNVIMLIKSAVNKSKDN